MEESKLRCAILHKIPTAGPVLRSNMSKLTIKIEKVFQYSIEFSPKVEDSLTKKKRIITKGASKDLLPKLGNYIHLGNMIYSSKQTETFQVISSEKESEKKENYQISVNFVKTICMDGLDKMTYEMVQEVEMVFNIFLKKVMETNKLFPLRNNAFFDLSTIRDISETSLMIITGYFISISSIKEGLFLTIDTVNEIFKKTCCLDDLIKMKKTGQTNKEIGQSLSGKRVSLICSKAKSLRISGVNFDLNPMTCIIKPEEMTLATIWEKKYNLHIKSQTQPLLTYKRDKKTHYLIPEFCFFTGLEEESRQCSKVMNELAQCSTEPNEKFNKINGMFNQLIKKKAFEQCGLELTQLPSTLPLKILPSPPLSLSESVYLNIQDLSKPIPIMRPIFFLKWLCVYEKTNYSFTEKLFNSMLKASFLLNISIAEPVWLELSNINAKDVQQYLKNADCPQYQFVLVLLSNRRQYTEVKKVLEIDLGITSQFVHLTIKKVTSLSIASNIIKQITMKLGGELYNVDLPKEIPKNTMFVGIDVCHCGRESIVGFYSNASSNISKCYCDTASQKKGQEHISILLPFYKKALDSYLKGQGILPEYILIFRDGVGRSQRSQLISLELPQVLDAIKSFQGGYNPKVTLVIVNKRMHQRFVKEDQGIFSNPKPGTIVDDFLVEKDCSNFYLISAIARVGTVRPAHYYIAYNDNKDITTEIIQRVSFATAHMYYHAGCTVKVPAHIALADKKANLTSMLKGRSNEKLITSQSFI